MVRKNVEMDKEKMENKRNTLRFFYPQEWYNFLNGITNLVHRFIFLFLLHTGMRIAEAKSIKVKNINLDRQYITLLNAKGNKKRVVFFSDKLKEILPYHIKDKNPEDTLNFPSVQFLDRQIKKYTKKSGLDNPLEFSCHTLRKTHENWLCVKGVNSSVLGKHMGHSIGVAEQYYISQFIKPEEKEEIKREFRGLFEV